MFAKGRKMSNFIYIFSGIIALTAVISASVWIFFRLTQSPSFYKQIEKALEDQDFGRAKKLCLARIDSRPNDFILKYYLGQALEGLKDFSGAVMYYEKAAISASLEDEPLKGEIQFRTAMLLKKMHKEKEALG